MAYQQSFGLPTLAFRFFNVFGPLQAAGHAYAAVVPAFVDAALAGRPLTVHGDGRQSRDFTYVGTVAAVLTRAVVDTVTSPSPVNLAFGSRTDLLGRDRAARAAARPPGRGRPRRSPARRRAPLAGRRQPAALAVRGPRTGRPGDGPGRHRRLVARHRLVRPARRGERRRGPGASVPRQAPRRPRAAGAWSPSPPPCSARCARWPCGSRRRARCSSARSAVGRDGAPFEMVKFRSMRGGGQPDLPRRRPHHPGRSGPAAHLARRAAQPAQRGPGEMSVVGPRPTLAYQVERYDDRQRAPPRRAARAHRPGPGQRAQRAELAGAHRARPRVRRSAVGRARPADPGVDRPRAADRARGSRATRSTTRSPPSDRRPRRRPTGLTGPTPVRRPAARLRGAAACSHW